MVSAERPTGRREQERAVGADLDQAVGGEAPHHLRGGLDRDVHPARQAPPSSPARPCRASSAASAGSPGQPPTACCHDPHGVGSPRHGSRGARPSRSGRPIHWAAVSRLVECVPNVSEGRRRDVVDAIASAVETQPGAVLLDRTSDADHNRSVLTFAGEPAAVEAAMEAVAAAAIERIDMRQHQGQHPRLGAVDVVPFVPLGETSMAECVDAGAGLRCPARGALRGTRLSLRGGGDASGAPRPRGHPAAAVRRPCGGHGRGGRRARLRPGPAASDRGRRGGRRPAVPHRLEHRPRGHADVAIAKSHRQGRSASATAACRASRRWGCSSRSAAAPRCP